MSQQKQPNVPHQIAALYKFVRIEDRDAFREVLKDKCSEHELCGSFLVAYEGLNGTIGGTESQLMSFLEWLRSDQRFTEIDIKFSHSAFKPFRRMKVRLKNEIVTMGVEGTDPTKIVGTYIEPEAWNDLIADPEVILIDTRNDYEVGVGKFKGAINPKTKDFREFPQFVAENLDPKKTPKVAMYCTGGIRCEKASSLLKEKGFKEVFHLHGGILNYIEKIPEAQSSWEGDCFVFDRRVTVNHQLEPGEYTICGGCDRLLTAEDQQSPHYDFGIHCSECYTQISPQRMRSLKERQRQFFAGEFG